MVCVQPKPFDIGAHIDAVRKGDTRIGALATFVGCVRDINDGDDVRTLTLEHYPGMTERALTAIEHEARNRWDLIDVLIVHRVGKLRPADTVVLVVVAAAHRKEAFTACEFIMDYLKTRAPFWKQERTRHGTRWLDSRAGDRMAATRWQHAAANPEVIDGE